MYTKLLNVAVILRKVAGSLTALFRSHVSVGGARGTRMSLLGVSLGFALLLLIPLITLALIALVIAHPGVALAKTALATSPALVEKRQAFKEKQAKLMTVFADAKDGNVYDFSRKTVLEALGAKDSTEAVEKVKSANVELDNLGSELQVLEMKEVESSIGDRERARSTPLRGGEPQHPASDPTEAKTFGQQFIESKQFTEWQRRGDSRGQQGVGVEVDIGMKTLFQTSAGFAPQSIRSGLMVEGATRPIQLLDLIPTRPINQAVDKYMAETTRTHSSAEKAEGATYAESTFVWTEQTNTVRKITDSIPVTDEQIEDAPEIAAILDQRLRFGLRQRLDGQVFNGDGNAPNLLGLLNVSSIQTQAKGNDPVFDAVFKAMMKVRITGRAFPSAIIMHPTDWQNVRLTRTADGLYIMGNPSEQGPQTLFGLPVPLCDAGSAGTAVVVDLVNFTYIGERRGILVEIGYVSTQFSDGKKTIRADLRAVFTVTRAAAICTVTGL